MGAEPFCRSCRAAIDPGGPIEVAAADWAWAEFEYGGPVSDAIRAMKYQGRWEHARALAVPLVRSAGEAWDIVIPVPTTTERLLERGYNPARELARAWGRRVDGRAVGRRPGPKQVGRTRRERLDNLREVFFVRGTRVSGCRVLVVDDVVTTGATAESIALRLRRHGAIQVGFIALARTPRRSANG